MQRLAVIVLKLLFSGVSFGSIKLAEFGGTDFATAIAALGSIYIARKHSAFNSTEKLEDKGDSNV